MPLAGRGITCEICDKRIRLGTIQCKCGKAFCKEHVFPESHECKYDYKAEARQRLELENPVVTAAKVTSL